MTSYLNVNELAQSPVFRARVQAALAVKAADVLAEEAGTPRHLEKRKAYAAEVLTDPAAKVNGVIWLVVTNGTVREQGHDVADSDLEWVVGWAWDRLAGVTDQDKREPATPDEA